MLTFPVYTVSGTTRYIHDSPILPSNLNLQTTSPLKTLPHNTASNESSRPRMSLHEGYRLHLDGPTTGIRLVEAGPTRTAAELLEIYYEKLRLEPCPVTLFPWILA